MTSINNTTQRVANYNINNVNSLNKVNSVNSDNVAKNNSIIKDVTDINSTDNKLKKDAPTDNQKDVKDRNKEKPKNEQIKDAIETINKSMPNTEAVFGIHDKTNRVTIKIIDKDTREVVKEFPPEKTLDLIAKVWEMAGILVDEKR